ncbi:MAG: C39 family peptidase [Anaerolineae bacterium]
MTLYPGFVPKPPNAGTGLNVTLKAPVVGINLRSAPRTSGIRLLAVPNGTPLLWYKGGSVRADGYVWFWVEITQSGQGGWMALIASTTEEQFVVVPNPPPPPPPGVEKILEVPYYSQLTSPGAEMDSADCGETSCRMVIGWLLKKAGLQDFPGLTIDDLTRDIGKRPNAYMQLEDVRRLLAMYGFPTAQVTTHAMTLDGIAQQIDAGRPAIPLVKYAHIYPGDSFTGGHFLVAVGYSPTQIIVHDPYRGGANYRIARAQFELALTQWGNPPLNPPHSGVFLA